MISAAVAENPFAMMMCDVMPTISEDSGQGTNGGGGCGGGAGEGSGSGREDRDSQLSTGTDSSSVGGSGGGTNVEELMLSMFDERDKLMQKLNETQEQLEATKARLREVEKERDAFKTPQVSRVNISEKILLYKFVFLEC